VAAEGKVVRDGAVHVEQREDPLVVLLQVDGPVGAELLHEVTGEGHGVVPGEVNGVCGVEQVLEVGWDLLWGLGWRRRVRVCVVVCLLLWLLMLLWWLLLCMLLWAIV
jgi:hypothetical protein